MHFVYFCISYIVHLRKGVFGDVIVSCSAEGMCVSGVTIVTGL